MIYESIKNRPLSFFDECLNTAGNIYDTTNLPINLLLSGGLDSLVVAECFRYQDIPFIPYTFRLKGGMNDFDIKYAIDYCEYHGIKHHIIEIDYKTFWENELEFYCRNGQFTSPQFAIQCWLMDKTDGHIVLGNGWLNLTHRKYGDRIFEEEDFSWYYDRRWIDFRNREGSPKFFEHRPEHKLSSVYNDVVKGWIIYSTKLLDRHDSTKRTMYESIFPNLDTKRKIINVKSLRKKGQIYRTNAYSGFEYVYEDDLYYREKIKNLLDNEIPKENKLIPYVDMIDILINSDKNWERNLKQEIISAFYDSIDKMKKRDLKKILPED